MSLQERREAIPLVVPIYLSVYLSLCLSIYGEKQGLLTDIELGDPRLGLVRVGPKYQSVHLFACGTDRRQRFFHPVVPP